MTAGTVGKDVLTVHELRSTGDALWPRCGDADPDDDVVEWLRAVNCPECLREESPLRAGSQSLGV